MGSPSKKGESNFVFGGHLNIFILTKATFGFQEISWEFGEKVQKSTKIDKYLVPMHFCTYCIKLLFLIGFDA